MKKMRWSFTKFICNMVTLLSVLVMIWVSLSYFDILLNNSYHNRETSDYNALKIMVNIHNKLEK